MNKQQLIDFIDVVFCAEYIMLSNNPDIESKAQSNNITKQDYCGMVADVIINYTRLNKDIIK